MVQIDSRPRLTEETRSGPLAQRRSAPGRRWISVALVGILSVSALGAWSRTANFRIVALDGLALAYQVYDPAEVPQIDFGPQAAAGAHNAVELAESLQRWFPDYRIDVVISQPPLSHQPVHFSHEALDSARVTEFRQAAQPLLDASPDLFELSQQVRGLTRHDDARLPSMATDPLAYLRVAQEGVPLTCRYFAVIYGACAVSRGYTSRVIGLSRDGASAEHAVVEVYVPELARWILLDPDFNVAYCRGETWLNAAELHQAWLKLKHSMPHLNSHQPRQLTTVEVSGRLGIELVKLGEAAAELRETNLDAASATGVNLEYFQYVLYHTGNDYLSAHYPVGHPDRSRQYVLQPPGVAELPAICPEGELVADLQALYFPVGRTAVHVACPNSQPLELSITLSTWTPNFKHFETRIGDAGWQAQGSSMFAWQLEPGTNCLDARSVNLAGLPGETSHVCISVVSPPPSP